MNDMMNALRKASAFAVVASSFVISRAALASTIQQNVTLTDPLGGGESFTSVATAVAGFLFWDVASPLAIIMVLIGAFQLITSSGDPEKVSQGRKTIMYAAIGLVIALLAGGVVKIIQSFIAGASS
jgi:hypothetical protein